jgi:hypothetical protein
VAILPTPDPDNKQEMWLALTLIGNFARAGTEWVFVGALLILIAYIIGRFVYKTSLYLIEVYNERLREQGAHVQTFRWALSIAAFFGLIGVAVVFSGQPGSFLDGIAILANTFCLFSLFTVAYDWWLARKVKQATPVLGKVTVTDVLKMKQTVTAARQREQSTRS